jgi:hypothetical protein
MRLRGEPCQKAQTPADRQALCRFGKEGKARRTPSPPPTGQERAGPSLNSRACSRGAPRWDTFALACFRSRRTWTEPTRHAEPNRTYSVGPSCDALYVVV